MRLGREVVVIERGEEGIPEYFFRLRQRYFQGQAPTFNVRYHRIERLIIGAEAIVGMCGYNTFCEILSFDKRALIVPRMRPREEQYVRAVRAVELGLIDMLEPQNAEDPLRMAAALKSVLARPLPSTRNAQSMMNGLDTIAGYVEDIIKLRSRPALSVIKGGI